MQERVLYGAHDHAIQKFRKGTQNVRALRPQKTAPNMPPKLGFRWALSTHLFPQKSIVSTQLSQILTLVRVSTTPEFLRLSVGRTFLSGFWEIECLSHSFAHKIDDIIDVDFVLETLNLQKWRVSLSSVCDQHSIQSNWMPLKIDSKNFFLWPDVIECLR
jgi:hypothetical protein